MSTTAKVELKSVLTPKLWASLAVFSAIMSFIGVLTAPFGPSWMFSMVIGTFTAPIIVLFILLLLSKFAGFTMTPQQLALVYTASSMSVAFCYSMIPYGIIHNAAAVRLFQYNWHPTNWAVPSFWVFGPIIADPSEMVPIQTGGPIPWGQWAPFLAWWILYAILWLIFFTSWIGLLHQRWFEIERLPYPAALTGTLQIELIAAKGKDPKFKYFMLGVLLGALTILPVVAYNLYPAIPDIYGWTREPFLPWFLGTMDFSRIEKLGQTIPVIAFLPVNPMIYALFYLMPTKTLFTVWVFSLFGILIPSQIAFYMGYYSDLPTMANRFHAFMNGAPFRWNGWWIGTYLGLFLMWLVINFKYLKDVFMREAPERALPARFGTLMVVGSTVALIAMLIAAGASAPASLLIVLTMWLLFMSCIRVLGNVSLVGTAWVFPIDWSHLPTLVKYLYIPDPGYVTIEGANARPPQMVVDLWLANRWTGEIMAENNTNFGMAFAIPLCYKVGLDTGTHPRDITKIILTAGVISAVIGFTVGLWFSYAVGTNNTRMGMFDAWWHWVFGCPWSKVEEQFIPEPLAPYVAAGFILIAIISYLNFRFVWWPLDPVGVALAFGAAGTGWLIPSFVAWLARRIVYRVGGAKLDENVAIPIVIGFLVGYWTMIFIGALGSMIQFFLPR